MPGLDEEIANLAVAEVDRVLETYWWPTGNHLVTNLETYWWPTGDQLVTKLESNFKTNFSFTSVGDWLEIDCADKAMTQKIYLSLNVSYVFYEHISWKWQKRPFSSLLLQGGGC